MFTHTNVYKSELILSGTMGSSFKRRNKTKGRIPKPVRIARHPMTEGLTPLSKSARALYNGGARTIYIDLAEIEAQRLVDMEGLTQEEAGERMEVSRGTVWRLVQTARRKVAQCLAEGRPLLVLDERNKRTSLEPHAPSTPDQSRDQHSATDLMH